MYLNVVKMKKILICFGLLFVLSFAVPLRADAASEADAGSTEAERIYQNQSDALHTQALFDALPQKTRDSLAAMGITSLNYTQLTDIRFSDALKELADALKRESSTPLAGLSACVGMMLLCSLTEGFGTTLADNKLQTLSSAVGTAAVAAAVIVPLCSTIGRVSEIISGASGFMLLYVPIMAGLMISSGSQAGGTSYYSLMMTAGNVISVVSAKLIMPMMNVFLMLSVTSSLSPKMKLSAVCEAVLNGAKKLLTLLMSLFVTILSLQTFITSSMDHVSKRALRFAVGSFVPVVGSVLGDALTAFNGSLELLKSGAGVFVVIAAAVLILPVLGECFIWQFALFVMSAVSEILSLPQLRQLCTTVSKAVGMLVALLASMLVVFVISTVLILLAGNSL